MNQCCEFDHIVKEQRELRVVVASESQRIDSVKDSERCWWVYFDKQSEARK